MKLQFDTHINQFSSNLWDYHFMVPESICEVMISETHRRVVCEINGSLTMHCALMPDGNGQFFININKENRKKLGIGAGSPLSVMIWKDDSKYGIPLPEEMKELLDLDPEGSDFFHALTPGKQRSLLHFIGKFKSSDVRIKKALVILDYLKDNNGKLDFRELNEAFKLAANKYF